MRAAVFLSLFLSVAAPFAVAGGAGSKILVPAGVVIMGSDAASLKEQLGDSRARVSWYADETPSRKIEVGAFMIDVTEVTNREYKKVFADHTYPPNLADHPVVNVTWAKADEYCRNVGGRLPTEAEWERAARGSDGRIYPWGDEFDPSRVVYMGSAGADQKLKIGSFELEESSSSALGGTSAVGSREQGKSPFGVYDMAGNVWEWVDGWYDEKRKLRLLKGGSWLTPRASVRSATRLGDSGDSRFNDYGFRCAYDVNR